MLIIWKRKSGYKVFHFELGSIETMDMNPEALKERYGELRPVLAYKIIGRFGGDPVILGEYVNKQNRDEDFERFIDALVRHDCQTYGSVEKDGEVIFRPYSTDDAPTGR